MADARDSIEIRPLSFPDDVLPFVRSWWRIYRDDPHWARIYKTYRSYEVRL